MTELRRLVLGISTVAAVIVAAAGGAAVLFSSSDPEELAAVADRVIVMSDGAVTTELSGGSLTVDNLIRASLAVAPQGERA